MKKVLVMFLGVFLLLTVAGCGGGSGSNGGDDSEIKISSDYFGIEKGLKLTYDVTTIENGVTTTETSIQYTVGEASQYGTNVYKNVNGTSITEGDYIKVDGDNYYYYGGWSKNVADKIKDTPELIITKPITMSFTSSPYWGENKGQEKVTVPAGTFTAWVFKRNYSYEGNTCCDKNWFVPYLGIVKVLNTETQNGTIISQETDQLKSYAKNSTLD